MPALWNTASKRPSLLTSSATFLAPAMVERSPETTPPAPAAAASASRLRPSFRPCNTTSWPWSIRSRAAMRPRPSDDPVMNTRATSYLLSSRRPFRLTIPNGLPAPRVFPCTRHDARRESLCNPGGRRSAGGAAPAALVRAEAEINSTTQQKADAASITSLPEVLASRLANCPGISSLARRDRATALGGSARARTRQPGKAMPRVTAAVRVGGQEAQLLRPLGPGKLGPRTNRRSRSIKNDEVDFRPSIRADRGSYLPGGTDRSYQAGEGRWRRRSCAGLVSMLMLSLAGSVPTAARIPPMIFRADCSLER